MPKKLSDRDLMVYLRNTTLALVRLAKERGVNLEIYAGRDGYGSARVGDYKHFQTEGVGELYSYAPLSDVKSWKNNITPAQIVSLTRPPKENAPRPTKATRDMDK